MKSFSLTKEDLKGFEKIFQMDFLKGFYKDVSDISTFSMQYFLAILKQCGVSKMNFGKVTLWCRACRVKCMYFSLMPQLLGHFVIDDMKPGKWVLCTQRL